jgi:hypothetical protein
MVVIRPTYGMVALRQAVVAMAEAMRDEGVDPAIARRVVNRLIWGDPDGSTESSRHSSGLLRELEETQQALDAIDEEADHRKHAIDSAQRHRIAKESTYGTPSPPMKTIPFEPEPTGHWVEASSCRINHPYGEDGWRPYFGPHLNKEKNYQLHEHWIED